MVRLTFLLPFWVSFIQFFPTTLLAQDSTYYFNKDSTKNWWYIQEDVFSFRCSGGSAFSGTCDPLVVDNVVHNPSESHQLNELHFSSNSSSAQRQSEKSAIFGSGQFEHQVLTVTQQPNSSYHNGEYIKTTDLVMVQFKDPNITMVDVNDFMSRNGISLDHAPSSSLPSGVSWLYVFKINHEIWANTFEAAREIFLQEHSIIHFCEPDMILFKPEGCETTAEMDYYGNGITPDELWHIRNQGEDISYLKSGTLDADADICECWGEGYHGEGIKVAVIDFHGFHYDHPDMIGQFLDGYDCINEVPFSDTYYQSNGWHAMAVSSIIAGRANNTGFSAVGVAYKAKVIPILVAGSTGDIATGISKAVEMGADVINMSFGMVGTMPDPDWIVEIENARLTGRGGLGCVCVAATGNANNDLGNSFPAAMDGVLGVGATDPNDLRGNRYNTDTWGWGNPGLDGSNYYTPQPGDVDMPFQVMAPGSSIRCAKTEHATGNHANGRATGTSFAAPVVSGMAAIALSKNYGLTESQVREAIVANAEQVNSGIYNYNGYPQWPGYHPEMFYGRVNCPGMLNDFPVSIIEKERSTLNSINYGNGVYGVYSSSNIDWTNV